VPCNRSIEYPKKKVAVTSCLFRMCEVERERKMIYFFRMWWTAVRF